MDDKEIEKILWISGLKNAVKFNGKPNSKAIMGKLIAKMPELRPHVKKIHPMLEKIVKQITKLNLKEQKIKLLQLDPHALEKKESLVEEKKLPDLPRANEFEKIVMRLAPYPSGALHIGNARMIVLNDEYVKKYGGELILFYDDTIGSPKSLRDSPKAKFVLPEAYDLIKEGLEWLDVKIEKVFYKSDRLEVFYEYCEKLIKDNIAYVCFCDAEEFRQKYKKLKKNCPHRDQSIDKNLEEWRLMLHRKYREGEAVVRLKTGMKQKDPALRDQIIMRISEAEHPKVGTKYVIWPMLEFSWAIDDYLLGITHILRGTDLVKEDFIEEFVWDHFGWKKAEFLHYGRINFPDLKLSKTEARNKIQSGNYRGWDDPRTWSLQSLKKRGIRAEAVRESLLDLGMSITGIKFSVNWLYSKNQDIIDELSERYFYVENPITILVENVPFEKYFAEPLLLPSKPEKGRRKIEIKSKNSQLEIYISFSDAQKTKSKQIIRLKDLINIKVNKVDLKKRTIKAEFYSTKLEREERFSIIQWVSVDRNIKVKILKPNGKISEGFGEINLFNIPMEKVIQFERYGFVNPIEIKNNCLFCYFAH